MASAGSLHPQVDVDLIAVQDEILCGEYRPALNDQELDPMDFISDIWERPPDRDLHVFVSLPGGVGGLTLDGECPIWLMLSITCGDACIPTTAQIR